MIRCVTSQEVTNGSVCVQVSTVSHISCFDVRSEPSFNDLCLPKTDIYEVLSGHVGVQVALQNVCKQGTRIVAVLLRSVCTDSVAILGNVRYKVAGVPLPGLICSQERAECAKVASFTTCCGATYGISLRPIPGVQLKD